MTRPIYILLALGLLACSKLPTGPADSSNSPKATASPLSIDLRIGSDFTAQEKEWLHSSAQLLATALSQTPPVALEAIPDIDPFHKRRLQLEGVVSIEGVRIYVESLESHHIEGRHNDLAVGYGKQVYLRSSQEYTRGAGDRRTVVGAIFIHTERIGNDELVFKRNVIHQLTHALGATPSSACEDLSVAFDKLALLGYEVRESGLQDLLAFISIDLHQNDLCLLKENSPQ